MKINLLDAGLCEMAGHHYDFDRKLLRHLTAAGHQVNVYGFEGMEPDVIEEFSAYGAVTPLLRRSPYFSPDQYDDYAGELETVSDDSRVLALDLASVEDCDLWIWPSMRVPHLNACTLRGVRVPVVGCIHEDPGIEAKTIGALLWRSAFLSAARRRLAFAVGSVEPEISHRFSLITPDRRCLFFPQPFDGPPLEKPKGALKRIGFFGHQRWEKGLDVLEPLIERLLADGYAVTYQSSSPKYKGPENSQVELLGFVDDIATPIRSCDLVVLPYNVEQYRMKGSGILAQCMALGIPVAAPVGTLPGRLVEQHGLGPLFTSPTQHVIYKAIKVGHRNYDAFASNALAAAHQFNQRNGIARFAATFLAGAHTKPAG